MATTQTQVVHRKPIQVRESPTTSIILGPSPARSSSRHQPRDDCVAPRPQTGRRKRGQNTSSAGSSSSTHSELKRDSWRAINTHSAASGRSEQSLGILDYYLEPLKNSSEDASIDPAMKQFDFGLVSKQTPATLKPSTEAQDELHELVPQRTSREHFLRLMQRTPQPKKRRAGHVWSQRDRRRSSLSICCRGGPEEAYISPIHQQADVSPTSNRKRSFTSSNRSRKDSAASLQEQRSPTDSRFTASSHSKTSRQSQSWSSDTGSSHQSGSWDTSDILRLSAGSSSTQSSARKRNLSSFFGRSSSTRSDDVRTEIKSPSAASSGSTLSSKVRRFILCS